MKISMIGGLAALLLSHVVAAGSWYGDITYTGSDGNLPESPVTKVDNSDTGWQISAGYDVNEHFAIEFGYVDFGSQDLRLVGPSVSGPTISPTLNPFTPALGGPLIATPVVGIASTPPEVPGFTTETRGIRLASIGKLSIAASVDLDFQAGALIPRYKTTQQFYTYDVQPGGILVNPRLNSRTEISNEPEIFVGMGIHWSVNSTMGVKLFWEKMNDLGNENTFEQDIDTYNLALRYQF